MKNPEQHAATCLSVLTSGFTEDHFARIGDSKTVSIGDGVHINLEVLDMERLHTLYLVRVMDDKKLESCAWKVQVYALGFARAITFEQHGVIQMRADREVDLSRDYETFARINGFFQDFLDSCLSELSQSMECAA